MRSTSCLRVALLVAIPLLAQDAFGIGSGGILNLVPQAQVLVSDGAAWRHQDGYRVFVHPMEGSLLLLPPASETALALDKNKKHAIVVATKDIRFIEDGRAVDVPENTPFRVLKVVPHFNRTFAEFVTENGERFRIRVPR